ncbi:MAG: fumarylacetoacetate hydrolase family protein [Bryobacteraceae bacterium]|nr:fumarylacetoacetate hydrolase family protein [Bryobacteraceae bacterium]
MRIVTFHRGGAAPEVGIVDGNRVIGLASAGYASVLDLIERWDDAQPDVDSFLADADKEAVADLASVTLMAPIPRPPKLICVGLNYHDHAVESGLPIPTIPVIFNKFPNVVVGPGEPIVLPSVSEKPDYEVELAVVIGKGGRRIAAADSMKHVFGYTILNDVSARDYQMQTSQWLMGKTFDTFAPMGPWIVTADAIGDPHALDISMEIGGEVRQNSNTRELIFRIPELIAFLSGVVTLEPGDIISTGTPAGVGLGFKPPKWLEAGQECVARIQGIGELRNPCVAEKAGAAQA